jgi:PKD repeat protein
VVAVVAAWAILAPAASAVIQRTAHAGLIGVTPRAGVKLAPAPVPGLAPPRGAHALGNALAAPTSTGSLEYHGGIVLHTTRPYLIFWDPAGQIDAPTRALFSRYLSDVGADSALHDDFSGAFTASVFGVTRQYTDATGYAASGESFVAADQEIADAQPYPAASADCTSADATATPTCLTDAQMQAELGRLIAADGLPVGTGPGAPVYFVVTPATVNVCITTGECADDAFCAYHAGSIQNGADVIYATIPLLNAVKACQADSDPSQPYPLQEPNGIPADIAIDNLSHEYNEAISDPEFDAWYDTGSGNEEADFCQQYAATRDPVAGADPHAYAPAVAGGAVFGNLVDQEINGDPYYTQSEWSNGAGDCELRPGGAEVAAFNVSPIPEPGVPVVFHLMPMPGPFSSTTWSFGDGTGAFSATAPAAQSHTYAAPGTYTVSLTVVDGLGDVGTSTQTVTVQRSPIAAFTESTPVGGPAGIRMLFDGSASTDPNPGGRITSYSWNFGDGAAASGPTVAHDYRVPGDYTVSLSVVSSGGLWAMLTRHIRVESVLGVHLQWENAYSVAGVPERFDGRPDPVWQGVAVAYRWDFGDGATAAGPHVTHTYHRPGGYWVSLTLTTADGLRKSETRRLAIRPAEAITRLSATPAGRHSVRLKATVNGPGTLVIAGRRYTLAMAGSAACIMPLTASQRRALRTHHLLSLRVPVRFRPLVGRTVTTTAQVTVTS